MDKIQQRKCPKKPHAELWAIFVFVFVIGGVSGYAVRDIVTPVHASERAR